jgi:fido (protein-threonine AMPylation protein)
VAAVYFPTGPTRFAAIKNKYSSDLSGVPSERQGFVFVTNQTLSAHQRKSLTDIARTKGKEGDVLHLQQLVTLLDSAPGYGVRLQYLKMPMTIEDQLSWFLDSDSQVAKALSTNTRELLALRASIERIKTDQSQILQTLALAMPSGVTTPDLISVSSFQKSDGFKPVSGELSPSLLLLFHRLTCFDLPTRAVGQLRTNQVWLANREGQRVAHIEPPSAAEVEDSLVDLCIQWNIEYSKLSAPPSKLTAIAKFHAKFLLIHPFLDGNGRVARAILMQQCLDLFGRADMSLMNKGADYYRALQMADKGEYESLVALIDPVVHG